MFLFQYIIKLMVGNSDTLFMGLVVIIFGYYGWLLWNINESYKKFFIKWDSHEICMKTLKSRISQLDESVYKELIKKLDNNLIELEKMHDVVEKSNDELDRCRSDIIGEVKEAADEIKEIMKILMNHRSRSLTGHMRDLKGQNKTE